MRTLLLTFLLVATSLGCGGQADPNLFRIETSKGVMVIRLYDETPLHRDNFRKLVAEQFYDGTLFHRTIPNFMIQGGDPNSKDGNPMNNGMGGPDYRIPAEIQPQLFHKRGALAAARDNNPEKASSGSQFYIVHGRTYTEQELADIERQWSERRGAMQLDDAPYRIPEEQRQAYMTLGGVPWLDGEYTVFGELVEGFDVLDAIANAETPNMLGQSTNQILGDQPIEPVPMFVTPADGSGQ